MLPPGASVSGKAAQELHQGGDSAPPPGSEAPPEQPGPPLVQQEPEEADPALRGEADEAAQQPAPDVHLRPLGGGEAPEAAPPPPPPAQAAQGPSSGLSDDATRTSVDISQYMGDDQSIFRPIVREEQTGGTEDLMSQRRKKSALDEDKAPEIPENTRLARCLVVGLAISLFFAMAQFLITGNTVEVIYTSIPLGRGQNFLTMLKYGIASGLVFGFGLGALLVRFKKGSFLGMIVGILVGLSLGNGIWSMAPGAITGIIAGKFATIGVRRVINV